MRSRKRVVHQHGNFGPNEDDCKSVKDIINYITPKLKRKLDYSSK